jgi:elongator complex protein 3
VFGPEVPLSGQNKEAAQHKGLGRALLREAERIAREEFASAWCPERDGAKEGYCNEGYSVGEYMVVGHP